LNIHPDVTAEEAAFEIHQLQYNKLVRQPVSQRPFFDRKKV